MAEDKDDKEINSLIEPGEDTVQVKKIRQKDLVKNRVINFIGSCKSYHSSLFNSVWHNSDGLTVQEAFDAMGVHAVELHQLTEEIKTFVNGIAPDTITLADLKAVVENPDGTVTVQA